MFTQFVKSTSALERYRNGPFAQERHEYLTHLHQRGYGKARLIGINTQLLAIARQLQISAHGRVTKVEISKAAHTWMKERRQRSSRPLTATAARTDFISIASNWLRFLGWLDEVRPALPFADQFEEYLLHLREDRGLADATIHFRRVVLEPFFRWLAARGRMIATVTTKDVSE